MTIHSRTKEEEEGEAREKREKNDHEENHRRPATVASRRNEEMTDDPLYCHCPVFSKKLPSVCSKNSLV
jgi:hypothetical protein